MRISVLLLHYLLRFRRNDPSCFDPSINKSIEVFEKASESMRWAKRFFNSQNQTRNAKRVQSIIDGLENYLYYEGTEEVLTVLREFAGNMA